MGTNNKRGESRKTIWKGEDSGREKRLCTAEDRYRIRVRAVHKAPCHALAVAVSLASFSTFSSSFLSHQRSRPPRHPRHRRRRRRPWQTLLAHSISPSLYYESYLLRSSSFQLSPSSLQSPRPRRRRRPLHLSSSPLRFLGGPLSSLFSPCRLLLTFSMDLPSSSLPYSPKHGPIGPESKSMRSQGSSPSPV